VIDDLAAVRRALGASSPRHPAQVTADRLGDHYERYFDKLTPDERNALGLVRQALDEIAEGQR
jgi:hypothetical protein